MQASGGPWAVATYQQDRGGSTFTCELGLVTTFGDNTREWDCAVVHTGIVYSSGLLFGVTKK